MEAEQQSVPEYNLEAAADQAIAACDGDLRGTIKSLIIANNYVTKELECAWQQISPGYSRSKRTRRRSTGAREV